MFEPKIKLSRDLYDRLAQMAGDHHRAGQHELLAPRAERLAGIQTGHRQSALGGQCGRGLGR